MSGSAKTGDVLPDHPVKRTIGFSLAKTCKAHRGNVGGLLAEVGLHPGQEMVLIELWQEDGLRGGELAARLGVEPPTITKMLTRLERFDLVERRPDLNDARSFRAYLTAEGRTLEEPVHRIWKAAEERALDGLSADERHAFHELLLKVRSNLEPGFDRDDVDSGGSEV